MKLDDEFFLRSCEKALHSTSVETLSADRVNALGEQLGLTPQQTRILVRDLVREGSAELHWGGSLSLRKSERPDVVLGSGAIYIGEKANIGSGTAIGSHAMAAGEVINNQTSRELVEVVSDLVAAQVQLIDLVASHKLQVREDVSQLAKETGAVLRVLRERDADEGMIKGRLDSALKRLGEIAKATKDVQTVLPVLENCRQGFHWLFEHCGSLIHHLNLP